MKHSEFVIGMIFRCGEREWRCTDIGTRTIVAVRMDEIEVVKYVSDLPAGEKITRTLIRSEEEILRWLHGPPYSVAECVFDECDIEGCEAIR